MEENKKFDERPGMLYPERVMENFYKKVEQMVASFQDEGIILFPGVVVKFILGTDDPGIAATLEKWTMLLVTKGNEETVSKTRKELKALNVWSTGLWDRLFKDFSTAKTERLRFWFRLQMDHDVSDVVEIRPDWDPYLDEEDPNLLHLQESQKAKLEEAIRLHQQWGLQTASTTMVYNRLTWSKENEKKYSKSSRFTVVE